MTAKQVTSVWMRPKDGNWPQEGVDWYMARSHERWEAMCVRVRERRRAIRAAHRRYRRRLGLPLSK